MVNEFFLFEGKNNVPFSRSLTKFYDQVIYDSKDIFKNVLDLVC